MESCQIKVTHWTFDYGSKGIVFYLKSGQIRVPVDLRNWSGRPEFTVKNIPSEIRFSGRPPQVVRSTDACPVDHWFWSGRPLGVICSNTVLCSVFRSTATVDRSTDEVSKPEKSSPDLPKTFPNHGGTS